MFLVNYLLISDKSNETVTVEHTEATVVDTVEFCITNAEETGHQLLARCWDLLMFIMQQLKISQCNLPSVITP